MLLNSLLPALCLLTSVWAHPTPTTEDSNAERLAKGLKPRKPERLFDPTKTHVLKPRGSDPIVIESAVATVSYFYEPVRRDVSVEEEVLEQRDVLEKRDTMYMSMNPNNGNVYVSTTSPYTYRFNSPSEQRDKITGVVYTDPESLAFIGASRYYPQTGAPDDFGHLKFGMYNGGAVDYVGQVSVYVWNHPQVNSQAVLNWSYVNGTQVEGLNFYIDTGDNNRLCAAMRADSIRSTLTEAQRVVINFA